MVGYRQVVTVVSCHTIARKEVFAPLSADVFYFQVQVERGKTSLSHSTAGTCSISGGVRAATRIELGDAMQLLKSKRPNIMKQARAPCLPADGHAQSERRVFGGSRHHQQMCFLSSTRAFSLIGFHAGK